MNVLDIFNSCFKVKVIAGGQRSHELNSCPLHISLIPSPILKIFHTYMSNSLNKCAEQRLNTPCFKVKVIAGGQSSHEMNSCPLHIFLILGQILKIFHRRVQLIEQMCRAKVKDIVHQGQSQSWRSKVAQSEFVPYLLI